MNKPIVLLTLCAAVALPAMAQLSPSQTNLDPSAAAMESRNARGSQLRAVSPEQGQANALQRCAALPAHYKTDCEARVRGQGDVSGSVLGGGLLRETVTTVPPPPVTSPAPAPRQ
jgi:hypothetical protein